MKAFISIITILLAAMATNATPVPKDKSPTDPKEKPPPVMLPTGETNWGFLTQQDQFFSLEGHPRWSASGEIRKRRDGSIYVQILWVMKTDGELCPGIYRIEADGLHGIWGYEDLVTIDDDGNLTGDFYEDRTYRLKDDKEGR